MGRVVLVTGGSKGIGLAIARAFVESGDTVVSTHHRSKVPDGIAGVRCDVTCEAQVDAAFTEIEDRYGPVEILVSNAGGLERAPVTLMAQEQFNRILDLNLVSAYRVAHRAAPKMIRRRRGRMIFISSVMGESGAHGHSNYAASKAGLIGFARSLAQELGPRGITANVVAPGFIETDMSADLPAELRQAMTNRAALRRFGRPEEIASAVTWLAQEDAGYVTGAVIPVDAGILYGSGTG
jgi:3-oxoacyl-[acyl-carrier protein] reductase